MHVVFLKFFYLPQGHDKQWIGSSFKYMSILHFLARVMYTNGEREWMKSNFKYISIKSFHILHI